MKPIVSKNKKKAAKQASPRGAAYVAPAGVEVLPIEMPNGSQFDPDSYLDWIEAQGNAGAKRWVYDVRREKHAAQRPLPSANLTSVGDQPPREVRAALLDMIATLVDEHIFGRSDMCLQFAALLERALQAMVLGAEARTGSVDYLRTTGGRMRWTHAWVVLDDGSVIDGNADSIRENRVIGQNVIVDSYWGPTADLPDNRHIPLGKRLDDRDRNDPDVRRWWPRLENWMRKRQLLTSE